jgi:hypothetical protein
LKRSTEKEKVWLESAKLSRKSRLPGENDVISRKIKTSAGFSDFSPKTQKFS